MTPHEFIKTIYLGDRFCKGILLDGFTDKVKIQINEISRIRSNDGHWNFYNDENIVDGYIVFDDVESICFDPQGLIPNDEIHFEEKVDDIIVNGKEKYCFCLSAAVGMKNLEYKRISIKIVAKEIYLEDPKVLNIKIVD